MYDNSIQQPTPAPQEPLIQAYQRYLRATRLAYTVSVICLLIVIIVSVLLGLFYAPSHCGHNPNSNTCADFLAFAVITPLSCLCVPTGLCCALIDKDRIQQFAKNLPPNLAKTLADCNKLRFVTGLSLAASLLYAPIIILVSLIIAIV